MLTMSVNATGLPMEKRTPPLDCLVVCRSTWDSGLSRCAWLIRIYSELSRKGWDSRKAMIHIRLRRCVGSTRRRSGASPYKQTQDEHDKTAMGAAN